MLIRGPSFRLALATGVLALFVPIGREATASLITAATYTEVNNIVLSPSPSNPANNAALVFDAKSLAATANDSATIGPPVKTAGDSATLSPPSNVVEPLPASVIEAAGCAPVTRASPSRLSAIPSSSTAPRVDPGLVDLDQRRAGLADSSATLSTNFSLTKALTLSISFEAKIYQEVVIAKGVVGGGTAGGSMTITIKSVDAAGKPIGSSIVLWGPSGFAIDGDPMLNKFTLKGATTTAPLDPFSLNETLVGPGYVLDGPSTFLATTSAPLAAGSYQLSIRITSFATASVTAYTPPRGPRALDDGAGGDRRRPWPWRAGSVDPVERPAGAKAFAPAGDVSPARPGLRPPGGGGTGGRRRASRGPAGPSRRALGRPWGPSGRGAHRAVGAGGVVVGVAGRVGRADQVLGAAGEDAGHGTA